jgi:hypothetical protein
MTPIQQAIADIQTQIDAAKSVREVSEHAEAVIRVLTNTKNIVESLLYSERHTIEQAFKDGAISGKSMAHNGYAAYQNSADYFTKKYDTK